MRRSLLTAVLLAVVASPAIAQETGTPVLMGSERLFQKYDFGVSLSGPGSGYALEGFYRSAAGPTADFGFRAGYADPSGDAKSTFLIGADYRLRLINHSDNFPMNGSLVVGVGGSLATGQNVLYVPVGFAMGRTILLENSSTSFAPYVTPTLVPAFADNSDLLFTMGLGVDIKFGQQFDLNVGGAIFDQDGFSVSFSWLH
jgi:opacity protein-like surface antigen